MKQVRTVMAVRVPGMIIKIENYFAGGVKLSFEEPTRIDWSGRQPQAIKGGPVMIESLYIERIADIEKLAAAMLAVSRGLYVVQHGPDEGHI